MAYSYSGKASDLPPSGCGHSHFRFHLILAKWAINYYDIYGICKQCVLPTGHWESRGIMQTAGHYFFQVTFCSWTWLLSRLSSSDKVNSRHRQHPFIYSDNVNARHRQLLMVTVAPLEFR